MKNYVIHQKRLKYRLREWPGLTEERREELQKKIDHWNEDKKVIYMYIVPVDDSFLKHFPNNH